jgi:hypothetical protein
VLDILFDSLVYYRPDNEDKSYNSKDDDDDDETTTTTTKTVQSRNKPRKF